MPLINVEPITFPLTSAQGLEMGVGRAEGLHLSDIIFFIRTRYHDEKLSRSLESLDEGRGFISGGFANEVLFEVSMKEYLRMAVGAIVRPGECEIDGIFMNPDGINADTGAVEEFKATWKTARKGATPEALAEHFDYWLWQIAGYCKALGTTTANLTCFWVNGDYTYKPPFGKPHFKRYSFEFTQEEIDGYWDTVLGVAAQMAEYSVCRRCRNYFIGGCEYCAWAAEKGLGH